LSSVQSSTIADIHDASVNICLQGSVSQNDFERSKAWALRAALTWMRALKVVDDKVSDKVGFDCKLRHLTINLKNGSGTSYASPGVANIFMTRPYGTWTHELGHALAGLSDTYAGGAGSCKSGQPQSLMCWGAYGPRANPEQFSTLWPDDIAGIRYNHQRLFGQQSTAPDWADSVNPEAPINSAEPWPSAFVTRDQGHFAVTILPGASATAIVVNDPASIDL